MGGYDGRDENHLSSGAPLCPSFGYTALRCTVPIIRYCKTVLHHCAVLPDHTALLCGIVLYVPSSFYFIAPAPPLLTAPRRCPCPPAFLPLAFFIRPSRLSRLATTCSGTASSDAIWEARTQGQVCGRYPCRARRKRHGCNEGPLVAMRGPWLQ